VLISNQSLILKSECRKPVPIKRAGAWYHVTARENWRFSMSPGACTKRSADDVCRASIALYLGSPQPWAVLDFSETIFLATRTEKEKIKFNIVKKQFQPLILDRLKDLFRDQASYDLLLTFFPGTSSRKLPPFDRLFRSLDP
jgi:hypothetical protein